MAKAAELVVKCLEKQGVTHIFGIPGAKVDSIFNALEDSAIKLVLCRHEQNAVFMAAAWGRLSGEPGIVLVTSGPGVGNLTTGLLTATTEGDPVVAIGANVPRSQLYKNTHQSAPNMKIMEAVTKSSREVYDTSMVTEVIANAFRTAKSPKSGACFLSFPQDILLAETDIQTIDYYPVFLGGQADQAALERAAGVINQARHPVLLLGEEASRPANAQAIRALLAQHQLPVVSTYQAAGVVSRELLYLFFGRVGLFPNQLGDQVIDKADCIITVGFNCAEYDPEVWNRKGSKSLVHVDYQMADIHQVYQPGAEIIGNIADNITALAARISVSGRLEDYKPLREAFTAISQQTRAHQDTRGKIHPLRMVAMLEQVVDEKTVITCDIGSIYMWLARYFLSYVPHQVLFSNGQQTLGVGLPWGMAARMYDPSRTVISLSGDGGFLFSAMEMETAVREQLHIIHIVWVDRCYNMVKEQEEMKYHRPSGVDFGEIDLVQFAQSFGAAGYRLDDSREFPEVFAKACMHSGPVLIEVPIDYTDNPSLFAA